MNLNSVLEETLTLVQHPFKTAQRERPQGLRATFAARAWLDQPLQQVFLNLFLNARDAMPNGGMLEVRTTAYNGSSKSKSQTPALAFPPEHLHRIFDPFFTTKATGQGTGLGLSVSYGIIKEHAGKVDVRSTPGKGTSFRSNSRLQKK